MSTPDFFRSRLDAMVDPRHPLVVLAERLDWEQIEARIAPLFAPGELRRAVEDADLFGPVSGTVGVHAGGRPRLPPRLMVSLLYLKHAYGESDESVCERWSENVVWQCFSGIAYYTPKLPYDPTQMGRFRRVLGEAGAEELLSQTITTAVKLDALERQALETAVVDTTVQEKAVAYPTDSRLLEVARRKVALEVGRAGVELKWSYGKEGRQLRRRAGGYAHARQFRCLRKALKRRQAVDLVIEHMKQDNWMARCWLKGAVGGNRPQPMLAAANDRRWLAQTRLLAPVPGMAGRAYRQPGGTIQSLSRPAWT